MSSARLSVDQRQIAMSGGTGRLSTAAQAGFLPIALAGITSQTLQAIPIYLQFGQKTDKDANPAENFSLRTPDLTENTLTRVFNFRERGASR